MVGFPTRKKGLNRQFGRELLSKFDWFSNFGFWIKMVERKYGIVSDVEHPYLLRGALAEFRKRGVEAVISLGRPETRLRTVEHCFETLAVSKTESYFYGLSEEAKKVMEFWQRNLMWKNLREANNLGQKIMNGNHEIIFFSEEDLARVRAQGLDGVLPAVEYAGRTVVASHYPLLGERAGDENLISALALKGIKKFVSASKGKGGMFYAGVDLDGNLVMLGQESDKLIWDAGSLQEHRCGILNVHKNGRVSYENLRIKELGQIWFRKSGVEYTRKKRKER